jgi:hypothetical protein
MRFRYANTRLRGGGGARARARHSRLATPLRSLGPNPVPECFSRLH